MASINLWVYAARPKTLFIGAAPILIGNTMAFFTSTFSFSIFFWSLFGALLIQIGTNYSNDYFDYIKGADTSKRKGSKKVLEQGLVSLNAMKAAFILCFSLAGVCTLVLMKRGGLPLLVIGFICILFSLLYTSPPFPLAYLGLGDLFVFVFYGPIATLSCYYLQTYSLSYEVFTASLMPGLLGLGPLIINNIRDYHEDKIVNKKTLIVRFGLTFGKIYYLMIALICFLTPLYTYASGNRHIISITPIFPLLLFIPCIKDLFSSKSLGNLQPIFIKTAKIIPIYTLFFCVCYLIEFFFI